MTRQETLQWQGWHSDLAFRLRTDRSPLPRRLSRFLWSLSHSVRIDPMSTELATPLDVGTCSTTNQKISNECMPGERRMPQDVEPVKMFLIVRRVVDFKSEHRHIHLFVARIGIIKETCEILQPFFTQFLQHSQTIKQTKHSSTTISEKRTRHPQQQTLWPCGSMKPELIAVTTVFSTVGVITFIHLAVLFHYEQQYVRSTISKTTQGFKEWKTKKLEKWDKLKTKMRNAWPSRPADSSSVSDGKSVVVDIEQIEDDAVTLDGGDKDKQGDKDKCPSEVASRHEAVCHSLDAKDVKPYDDHIHRSHSHITTSSDRTFVESEGSSPSRNHSHSSGSHHTHSSGSHHTHSSGSHHTHSSGSHHTFHDHSGGFSSSYDSWGDSGCGGDSGGGGGGGGGGDSGGGGCGGGD
ncbi:hypothetical protein B0O80DRAFT_40672 [Mortierella sp. GBAus27b]|nr:hypothetical protein B0O80DRAFT_40672 [Mortierella sp. GBAus27b]